MLGLLEVGLGGKWVALDYVALGSVCVGDVQGVVLNQEETHASVGRVEWRLGLVAFIVRGSA